MPAGLTIVVRQQAGLTNSMGRKKLALGQHYQHGYCSPQSSAGLLLSPTCTSILSLVSNGTVSFHTQSEEMTRNVTLPGLWPLKGGGLHRFRRGISLGLSGGGHHPRGGVLTIAIGALPDGDRMVVGHL